MIEADQHQGVYHQGPYIIFQSSGRTNIVGGGTKGSDDTVVQYKGRGLVNVDSYCVQDFFQALPSVIAQNVKLRAGVNSNYGGGVATIDTKPNSYNSLTSVCATFQANKKGDEPTTLTKNKSNASCNF
ncbi:unnamed protein product [Rhizoctonia solani]|uniref:Pectate lyase n=1 Tax=Rhizoctonia solani TaxID=456999 RepID=A0A8H3AX28_9AGAM|nr:unnamed protein product [Rhizoctonia solani]